MRREPRGPLWYEDARALARPHVAADEVGHVHAIRRSRTERLRRYHLRRTTREASVPDAGTKWRKLGDREAPHRGLERSRACRRGHHDEIRDPARRRPVDV